MIGKYLNLGSVNTPNRGSNPGFNESKGIAILLVVFGHNKIFQAVFTEVISLIYFFHVMFFLVYVASSKPEGVYKLLQRTRRYLIPYITFTLLSWVAFTFVFDGELEFFDYLLAVILGSAPLLRDVVGFGFFWFVSAAITGIWVSYIGIRYPSLRAVLMAFSLFVFYLVFYMGVEPYGVLLGISCFWVSSLYFLVFRSIDKLGLSVMLEVVVVVILFSMRGDSELNFGEGVIKGDFVTVLLVLLFGVRFLDLIGEVLTKSDVSILGGVRFLGKHSFQVYLLHSFFSYSLYIILPESMIYGFINFFSTVALCVISILVLKKIKLYKYLFPKG